MNIQNVQFLKSATDIDQRPLPLKPEVAVVGRSNVGKSTLINILFNRKNLARTSSIPGKTRLINYFIVDDQLYFVDLPGYGFAKISKKDKNSWQKGIESYLRNNISLKLVLLLIDSRHKMMRNDRMMIDWLKFYKIPFVLILTKCDKVSNNQIHVTSSKLKNEFPDQNIVKFSARTRMGREDIIHLLQQLAETNN